MCDDQLASHSSYSQGQTTNLTGDHDGEIRLSHDDHELNAAIDRFAAQETGHVHPDYTACPESVSKLLSERVGQLNAAIYCCWLALRRIDPGHSRNTAHLDSLWKLLSERAGQTEEDHEVNAAIDHCRFTVPETAQYHTDNTTCLDSLWKLLSERAGQTENLDDINAAIYCCWLTLQETACDHPSNLTRLDSLFKLLSDRALQTEKLDEINAAIYCCCFILRGMAHTDANYAARLDNFGRLLDYREEATNRIEDCNWAILFWQFAIRRTPQDHADLTARLNSLSEMLRYRRYRPEIPLSLHDLDAAIRHCHVVVQATARNHPDFMARLDILADLFDSRFGSRGSVPDIYCAISLTQHATTMSKSDDDRSVERFFQLGRRFELLFSAENNNAYLETAIFWSVRALKATTENSDCFPTRLADLAHKLGMRYEVSANIEDIKMVVSLYEQALKATTGDRDGGQFRKDCLEEHGDAMKELGQRGS